MAETPEPAATPADDGNGGQPSPEALDDGSSPEPSPMEARDEPSPGDDDDEAEERDDDGKPLPRRAREGYPLGLVADGVRDSVAALAAGVADLRAHPEMALRGDVAKLLEQAEADASALIRHAQALSSLARGQAPGPEYGPRPSSLAQSRSVEMFSRYLDVLGEQNQGITEPVAQRLLFALETACDVVEDDFPGWLLRCSEDPGLVDESDVARMLDAPETPERTIANARRRARWASKALGAHQRDDWGRHVFYRLIIFKRSHDQHEPCGVAAGERAVLTAFPQCLFRMVGFWLFGVTDETLVHRLQVGNGPGMIEGGPVPGQIFASGLSLAMLGDYMQVVPAGEFGARSSDPLGPELRRHLMQRGQITGMRANAVEAYLRHYQAALTEEGAEMWAKQWPAAERVANLGNTIVLDVEGPATHAVAVGLSVE